MFLEQALFFEETAILTPFVCLLNESCLSFEVKFTTSSRSDSSCAELIGFLAKTLSLGPKKLPFFKIILVLREKFIFCFRKMEKNSDFYSEFSDDLAVFDHFIKISVQLC